VKYTNVHNLPEPIVRAVENDPYDAGVADISTTRLILPPQIDALKRRYKDQIEEDVSERLWTLLGQSVHVILERAAGGGQHITEQRYFAEMEGWVLSGAVDFLDTKKEVLVDYKVTSVWTYIYRSRMEEWAAQGNINRWLYWKNTGQVIKKLQNILILRDWQKRDINRRGYPMVQIVGVRLPVWSMDKAEAYVRERVKLHQAARKAADDGMPKCSDEDRWWSAKEKVFKRCAEYCPVAKFCKQFEADNERNREPIAASDTSKDQGL